MAVFTLGDGYWWQGAPAQSAGNVVLAVARPVDSLNPLWGALIKKVAASKKAAQKQLKKQLQNISLKLASWCYTSTMDSICKYFNLDGTYWAEYLRMGRMLRQWHWWRRWWRRWFGTRRTCVRTPRRGQDCFSTFFAKSSLRTCLRSSRRSQRPEKERDGARLKQTL